jgi:hypothetical protein
MFKKQIYLAETAIFCFWQAEPAPDVAKQIRAGVEETGFCTPIPCCPGRLVIELEFISKMFWTYRLQRSCVVSHC